jgi:hypothetical protein
MRQTQVWGSVRVGWPPLSLRLIVDEGRLGRLEVEASVGQPLRSGPEARPCLDGGRSDDTRR